MDEVREVAGYIQGQDGGWILKPEVKAQADAMYYSNRLAYSAQDPRHPVGRYSPTGEVLHFKLWKTPVQE